jgi:hypothetical protein
MTTSLRPSLSISGRKTTEAAIIPIINGLRAMAACDGVLPSAVCRNRELT